MKKMPSLFKRDFSKRPSLAYNEITPGCEWVLSGEGVASVKYDGASCAVINGKLYKRYDIKPTKKAWKRKKRGSIDAYVKADFKPVPENAILCNESPDLITGHWPCWIPVGDEPESKWFREGLANTLDAMEFLPDGTYELVGPKIGKNPEGVDTTMMWPHGAEQIDPPRDFDGLRHWLESKSIEGIVFKHQDGRMCKLKRSDFRLPWPIEK